MNKVSGRAHVSIYNHRANAPFRRQRSHFSGNATQTNVGGVSWGGMGIVNGYPVDERYAHGCRTMHADSRGCAIDGRQCVLKEVDGVTMWTLEGVDEAPIIHSKDVYELPDGAPEIFSTKVRASKLLLDEVIKRLDDDVVESESSESSSTSSFSSDWSSESSSAGHVRPKKREKKKKQQPKERKRRRSAKKAKKE